MSGRLCHEALGTIQLKSKIPCQVKESVEYSNRGNGSSRPTLVSPQTQLNKGYLFRVHTREPMGCRPQHRTTPGPDLKWLLRVLVFDNKVYGPFTTCRGPLKDGWNYGKLKLKN
ncbi:hypothetical protein RF11_08445 [Thelohanellus kitauei]|uniref:Uncharacterized protein n=1 Tax=Thelohanellus kitauei TaxID=669202 RepID=A0A0C2MTB7_THEKT|nr:hypothetical protein RF11_08445 [Thelohanellus kitauei]